MYICISLSFSLPLLSLPLPLPLPPSLPTNNTNILRVAAANDKGFAVANFVLKNIILVHPTVTADGIQSRSIGRWVWFFVF